MGEIFRRKWTDCRLHRKWTDCRLAGSEAEGIGREYSEEGPSVGKSIKMKSVLESWQEH